MVVPNPRLVSTRPIPVQKHLVSWYHGLQSQAKPSFPSSVDPAGTATASLGLLTAGDANVPFDGSQKWVPDPRCGARPSGVGKSRLTRVKVCGPECLNQGDTDMRGCVRIKRLPIRPGLPRSSRARTPSKLCSRSVLAGCLAVDLNLDCLAVQSAQTTFHGISSPRYV